MGLNDSYEHGIARGVVRYAKQKPDWNLYGYGWMFRPLKELARWRGDGVISRVESAETAGTVEHLSIPVVDVAGAFPGEGFHLVTNDDRATGNKAGEYLLSCGFRNFAFCGVTGVGWSARRKAGFNDAVAGCCPEISCFERSLPWWENLEAGKGLTGWLTALPKPCGLFACNDTAGVKVTETSRALRITVPDDIAVLGVDNEDILCELANPALSSIILDLETIGYRAASLLDHLLSDDRTDSHPHSTGRLTEELVPPLSIVERDSTKIFTCSDPLTEKAVRVIRRRAAEGITVGDILGELAVSRRTLEKRFHKTLGRTPHDEIIRTRLSLAKRLLKETNRTVQAVAEDCGFGTVQRFYAVFRQAEGMSPGVYRS